MNRFNEHYDIRLAEYDEIGELMQFIDEYWRKGHILSTNRDFFMYEMVIDGKVNFLIAKNREIEKIESIIGFLPASKDKDKLDVWGVIWKSAPEAMPMLGIELMKRLPEIIGARTVLGVGANSKTAVPLLSRICHYYTCKMKHYYRLANLDDYAIAKVNHKVIPDYSDSENLKIIRIEDKEELKHFFDFSINKNKIPYKDEWYYCRRFLKHPVYKYDIYGLRLDDRKALMVIRKQEYDGRSVLRIVDYEGDPSLFEKCGSFLDEILIGNEYIDFYFAGFEENIVKSAGFVDIDAFDNIIPDYFHPFEQKNVDIYVVSSNNTDECSFFKADGDQDRPSY